jgi:hypothetical protein
LARPAQVRWLSIADKQSVSLTSPGGSLNGGIDLGKLLVEISDLGAVRAPV